MNGKKVVKQLEWRGRVSRMALLGLIALASLGVTHVGITLRGDHVAAAREDSATPETLTESERDELNRLRTVVAELPPCATTEAESSVDGLASPVPVVVVPTGVAVQTDNNWTVQVEGISASTPIDGETSTGQYLQVVIKVVNNDSVPRMFGLTKWVLVDEQGRTYELDRLGTTQQSGTIWPTELPPSKEITLTVVYDVAIGAGPSFTFMSRANSSLQFALTLRVLG